MGRRRGRKRREKLGDFQDDRRGRESVSCSPLQRSTQAHVQVQGPSCCRSHVFVYKLGHVSSVRLRGVSAGGNEAGNKLWLEDHNHGSQSSAQMTRLSQANWSPVVLTGPAATTCSLQGNNVCPKKEEREHAGVTRFSLPLPLCLWSGAVGTWLGFSQIIPAAVLTGGNRASRPCVCVLCASLCCSQPVLLSQPSHSHCTP